MENYKDIIAALKKQKPVEPPGALTDQVMAKLNQTNKKAFYEGLHGPFLPLVQKGKGASSPAGITTYSECVFLLFLVGSFYLLAGLTAVWRLHDAVTAGHLNFWLKIQPFIPVGSGLLMIAAALLILYRPQIAVFIKYILIIHVVFVFVNAVILEKMLSIPVAWIYVLILTMLAVVLGVLLIGSIGSVLKVQMSYEEENCAKTI